MAMRRTTVLLGMALLAGDCTAPSQVPYNLTTPFSDADFAPWTGSGPAALEGQAFLKTVGGDVKTCAGEDVGLLPATAYNREIVQSIRSGHENLVNRSGAADPYTRHSICDAQGNFSFVSLPAGTWIVWTNVEWTVLLSDTAASHEGGRLIREITLSPGENSVILADRDLMQ